MAYPKHGSFEIAVALDIQHFALIKHVLFLAKVRVRLSVGEVVLLLS